MDVYDALTMLRMLIPELEPCDREHVSETIGEALEWATAAAAGFPGEPAIRETIGECEVLPFPIDPRRY